MDPNTRGALKLFSTFTKVLNFKVADVLDRLLERQFLLSPWVREKRLRNQLRLVLKVNKFFELLDMRPFKNPFQNAESFLIVLSSLNQDHLEAGPVRSSTVTKVVHDAHQVKIVWQR